MKFFSPDISLQHLQIVQSGFYSHQQNYRLDVKIKVYIYIYISNIQSASEDSGCGLFMYRIYEEYHMGVLYVWLLLHIFFHQGLYNKTHIQSIYSAIRRKLKPG